MGDNITDRMMKYYARNDRSVTLNAANGHFATSQSHINFYIDVTRIKVRVNEAKEAARFLRGKLINQVESIDSIVCLDGTQVLGAFLGEEIEKGGFITNNAHETEYIVCPEENSIHQFMFRENNRIAVEGKNVIILVDNVTTGTTVQRATECVTYYGGTVCGIASIFSTVKMVDDIRVFTIFDDEDLPGYMAYNPAECPICAKKIPLDAMVNGYGYAKL